MAVQRKSQKNPPGEKKPLNWVKIVAVGFVILVVVMCVLSFSNFSNFFREYNITTPSGNEIVFDRDHVAVYFATNTEGQTVFSNFPKDENDEGAVFSVYASENPDITEDDFTSFSIKVGDESVPYRITAAERNAIAKAIVGKNYGDISGVGLEDASDIREYKAADLEAAGCDMSALKKGDVVPMVFTYTDENGAEKKYARCGVVTEVADDLSSATLNFGSDSVIVLVAGKYTS